MSSAKFTIKQQDRSSIVASLEGIYAGIVIESEKGDVDSPRLITNTDQLIKYYGKPNPKKYGKSIYSALNYLTQGNKLWVVRSTDQSAKYSGLVVPKFLEGSDQLPYSQRQSMNLLLKPTTGLSDKDISNYNFINGTLTNIPSTTTTTSTVTGVPVNSNTLVAGGSVTSTTVTPSLNPDLLLISSKNQGEWGNKISISILPSITYDDAFIIRVHYENELVESWEVMTDHFIDGLGNQLFIEELVNNKSDFINVKLNPTYSGQFVKPIFSTNSVWTQLPEDIFTTDTSLGLTTNPVIGNDYVLVGSNIPTGSRIKFKDKVSGGISSEYKVVSSNQGRVVLDRKIQLNDIFLTRTNILNISIMKFNATANDASQGITNGVKVFEPVTVYANTTNFSTGSYFKYLGIDGILSYSSVANLGGGTSGPVPSTGDRIRALMTLKNKEETRLNIIMDGGYATPAYAQAIHDLCVIHDLTHGYLSVPESNELDSDYLNSINYYRNTLNLDTEKCSLFTGWITQYDYFNEMEVTVAPDGIAAASQSFTTRNYSIFTPAA
jgi:hypothetical protein